MIQRNQSAAFSSGKVRPNHETNITIIARRTGKDVNSHTVLDGIITTIMATIQRINIIGSREGSRNRRRLKANQTGKKFRVGIKSNISTNRNNMISGVDSCNNMNAMKKIKNDTNNRRIQKANKTLKKFRVEIKNNNSTNKNNLISGVDRCIHLNAMKKTTITSINRQTIKI